MEHNGQQRTPQLLTPYRSRGAAGDISTGERISNEMGSNKQKQPLARRNGNEPSGGGSAGRQDIATAEPDAIAGVQAGVASQNGRQAKSIPSPARRLDQGDAEIKPKVYTPPPCTNCESRRPPNTNYSQVFSVHRTQGKVIRYIKCSYCLNRFKDVN